MKFFEKIFLFIKNMFNKKEEIKQIEAPKIDLYQNQKEEFLKSIKVSSIPRRKKNNIKTLVCVENGLGFENKLTY